MQTNEKCKLCSNQLRKHQYFLHNNEPRYVVDCPICGEYIITSKAVHLIDLGVGKDKLHLISGVTRNYFEQHKNNKSKLLRVKPVVVY